MGFFLKDKDEATKERRWNNLNKVDKEDLTPEERDEYNVLQKKFKPNKPKSSEHEKKKPTKNWLQRYSRRGGFIPRLADPMEINTGVFYGRGIEPEYSERVKIKRKKRRKMEYDNYRDIDYGSLGHDYVSDVGVNDDWSGWY